MSGRGKEITEPDLSILDGVNPARAIVVLPLGATEQHGPHLPPETDALIAQGIVAGLSSVLPPDPPVVFLPVESIGYSPEHMDWPVTRTLGFAEAVDRWIAIGEAAAARGFRKLLLLNAHGGNSPLMTVVATELRCRCNMLCVATSWTRFGFPPDVISPEEAILDIHAGLVETSVMLALHPEKVDMAMAADFSSAQARLLSQNRYLSAYGKHAFGWKIQDLNGEGATGNAAGATAQKGKALISHAVAGLAELVSEIGRFDPDGLA